MGEQINPLDALRDIHAPEPIGWWPPAPGWWLMLVLVLISVLAVKYWLKQKPRKKFSIDYSQTAFDELHRIEQALQHSGDEHQFISALTLLMKRYVHAYQPHASSLTGKDWLTFLDQTGGQGQFKNFYHQLCVAPYSHTPIEQKEQLIALVKSWIGQLPQQLNNMEKI